MQQAMDPSSSTFGHEARSPDWKTQGVGDGDDSSVLGLGGRSGSGGSGGSAAGFGWVSVEAPPPANGGAPGAQAVSPPDSESIGRAQQALAERSSVKSPVSPPGLNDALIVRNLTSQVSVVCEVRAMQRMMPFVKMGLVFFFMLMLIQPSSVVQTKLGYTTMLSVFVLEAERNLPSSARAGLRFLN